MVRILKPLLIITLFLSLGACSTLSGLKFWGDDDETQAPAALNDI